MQLSVTVLLMIAQLLVSPSKFIPVPPASWMTLLLMVTLVAVGLVHPPMSIA